jgi:prepilin-type N-terminal cleavage/methylation domain-containing protein
MAAPLSRARAGDGARPRLCEAESSVAAGAALAGNGACDPSRVMQNRRSDGFSLIEMMVATALALAILLVALSLLDLFRRSYLRSELAADAAQRARIAQESLAHDLRLAGLGVDPDGAAGRPDEAVEGAWAGALVMRGDLDADDSQARDDPERWIAGPYPTTRTGNDEIAAYALRDESGAGGADLTFEADVFSGATVTTPAGTVAAVRDGIVETVVLSRVLAGSGGPAGVRGVLYRASLANNAALWGTGNAVSWQPLADGVSALGFRYFDDAGGEIAPPGGTQADANVRARIARVEVRIVVLESRPDPAWSDPRDPDPATIHYRKVDATFSVALRSAGLRGVPDGG